MFAFICDLFANKAARVLRYVISVLSMIIFGTQIVYYNIFKSFMSLSQVSMGGEAIGNFYKSTLIAIWESLFVIILILLPLFVLRMLEKKLRPETEPNPKKLITYIVSFVVASLLSVIVLPLGGTGAYTAYDIYHDNWGLDLSVEHLGVLTTTGLDLKFLLFENNDSGIGENTDVPPSIVLPPDEGTDSETDGGTGDTGTDTSVGSDTEPPTPEQIYNMIEGLDFSKLAANEKDETVKAIFNYLAQVEPTKKNEYTGMFEGYNLIMITAESFSREAIHKDLTPTLYKLANSGFVFNNYWTTYPSNTTNGEYSVVTGLIPDIQKPKADGSFLYSANNTMNQTLAAFFNAQGVTSRAYHNNIGTYYSRNITHPNLGFVFKGKNEIGGLSGWPQSDLTMAQKTITEYINDDRFFTYYMTVSGHHNYKFGGVNSIADKNKHLVDHLDLGDSEKAYLACNIELDRMLESLISDLEKAGKLDKTVICLAPDHYPYGLTDAEHRSLRKYYGYKEYFDGMERYKSKMILWNPKMETVEIDKPCCPIDILPTLLNLFGFNYDSRLYSGNDILSDTYGLVVLQNQSYVTDKIVFNSRYATRDFQGVYKLDKSWTLPDNYRDTYIQIVKNRFDIAALLLNNDIYGKLPQDVILAAQRG